MNMAHASIADAWLGFVSGCGQGDTHAVSLSDGRPNPHQTAGQPYAAITGREIAAMVQNPPAPVPKSQARWIIPSDYREHDARVHDAQRARGRFHWLALDVDKKSLPLADVRAMVSAALGDCSALSYSTASATPDNLKWRVLVPLRDALAVEDYGDTQAAFFDLLKEASDGALVPYRPLSARRSSSTCRTP